MGYDVQFDPVVHVARKTHQCDHCRCPIAPGQQYERLRGVWDGTPGVFKCHIECRDCAYEMWKTRDYMNDEGITLYNDVEHDDYQWIRDEYPVVAERLGFGTRAAGIRSEGGKL